jgi:hypothetical protein
LMSVLKDDFAEPVTALGSVFFELFRGAFN